MSIIGVMVYTDKQILEVANTKDKLSYKRLYDVYYAALCRYASKLLHEVDRVEEDIVQEIFIRFWENKVVFSDVKALTTYLYRAVYNACVNYVRDRKEYAVCVVTEKWEEEEFDSEVNERLLIEEEYFRQIYMAIDMLSEQRRQILLKTLAGKKMEEIAREMNVSVNTVKTLKRKAYEELRKRISEAAFLFFLWWIHG